MANENRNIFLINDYELHEKLGEGSFGSVYKVIKNGEM